MTATLTPAVQTLIESFRNLSSDERDCFREEIAAMTDDAAIPEAHWEILMERERLHQQGAGQTIPWEEAKQQLRQKWGAR